MKRPSMTITGTITILMVVHARPDPAKIQALSTKYHASLGWDEWIPELTKKYKLRLFG
jgi:hypothetical protein